MHVPAPLPDELHLGYVGRVMRLNGFTNTQVFRKYLLRTPLKVAEVSIRTMSMLVGMPLGRYARLHSLMPFFHSVRVEREAQYAHEDVAVWYGDTTRLARVANEVSFCKDCVAEDQDFWGFSYWRRSHQIPGVDVCPKHGGALHRMARPGLLDPPAEFLSKAVEVAPAIVEQIQINEVVRRYQEICLLLLERDAPLPLDQVRSNLVVRSTELGLRACEIGTRPVLTDFVEETLAGPWLWEHFPGLLGRAKGKFHHPIDGILRSSHVAYSAAAYALGLACLFDSAEDALLTVSRPAPGAQDDAQLTLMDVSSEECKPKDQRLVRAIRAFLLGGALLEVCEQYHVPTTALEVMLRNISLKAFEGKML